ncbi:hypothetical protein G6F68_012379 [Rhizopus microsporus]|nr:hypothetical protein G6F68_012379 [Rhizopus microsporus]
MPSPVVSAPAPPRLMTEMGVAPLACPPSMTRRSEGELSSPSCVFTVSEPPAPTPRQRAGACQDCARGQRIGRAAQGSRQKERAALQRNAVGESGVGCPAPLLAAHRQRAEIGEHVVGHALAFQVGVAGGAARVRHPADHGTAAQDQRARTLRPHEDGRVARRAPVSFAIPRIDDRLVAVLAAIGIGMVGDDRSAGQVFHPREKAVSVGRVDVHAVGPGDAVGTGSPRADRTAVDQHVLGPAAALQGTR